MNLRDWFRGNRVLLLFGAEGILLQFVISMNGFGNNLFATNLGATDSQIGLIPLAPNLIACLLLLPMGLVAGRMRSSRTILVILTAVSGIGFFSYLFVPAAGKSGVNLFLMLLALTNGGIAIYNSQWQTFFADATTLKERNPVYTFRNRAMFAIAIAAPIVCGMLMNGQSSQQGKVNVLLIFFLLNGVMLFVQLFTLSRIPSRTREKNAGSAISLKDAASALRTAFSSKRFRLFLIPFCLFYAFWQLDWSMWYIGQVQYVKLNETELALFNGLFNIGQLLCIGPVSYLVRKKTPDWTIMLGAAGLCFCPIIIIVASLIPVHSVSVGVFFVLVTVLNAPQCAVALCAMHILLDVTPESNRSLIVNLYTMITTLSNSIMPFLGVQLYNLLGADWRAFLIFNGVTLFVRTSVLVMMFFRFKYLSRKQMLTSVE